MCFADYITRNEKENDMGMMDCPVWAICEMTSGDYGDHESRFVVEGLWFTAEEAEQWIKTNPHHCNKTTHVYGTINLYLQWAIERPATCF